MPASTTVMRLLRIPPLALSLLLQVMPLLRFASTEAALALPPVMAVLRLIAGATAVAGSYHAVSGATAPTFQSSLNQVGAVGINLTYRIRLSGGTPESFRAEPLPPGVELTLVKDRNNRVTGAELKGLPTEPGETVSRITAWDNDNFTGENVSADVRFVIADLQPLHLSVPAGQSITFHVVGPQGASVTYLWQHDDQPIPEATDASLTIPAVTESDAGQYRVRLALGSTSVFTQRATLIVTPPSDLPNFTETPSDTTLHVGEPLLLRAIATGEGSLSFAWTKDGDPVPAATSAHFELPAVVPGDAGSYRVTVSSSGGSLTSPPAVVTIVPPLALGAVSWEAGQFLIPFNGIVGRTYLLETQVTLGATGWTTVSEQDADASSVFNVPGSEADEVRIFRVRTP